MAHHDPSQFPTAILVNWTFALETVEIDLAVINSGQPVKATREWWKETGETVSYKTSSTLEVLSADKIRLSIKYELSENQDLPDAEYLWGTSRLTLERGATKGLAEWFDEKTPKTGVRCSWKTLYSSLLSAKRRQTVTRLERRQAAFRKELFKYDDCCAITEEKTKAVLEAAHVISAKDGGKEHCLNGLILRADLHLLYDAKLFHINSMGRLIPSRGLNKYYRSLLKSAERIPENVLQRIKSALQLKRTNEA